MANVMAELYATGLDEQYFYEWSENIKAITPEVAHAAAVALIKPRAAVTGYLLPEEKPVVAPVAPAPVAAPVAAPNPVMQVPYGL